MLLPHRMAMTTIHALASVIIVSLVSFAGAATLFLRKQDINRFLLVFASISAGTLFGGAFLHLLPEAVEEAGAFNASISVFVLAGIIVFFLLDQLIHWKHSHASSSLVHTVDRSSKSIAYLNLLGDGLHNFLDGLLIAGSYLVSIPTGVSTTLAVVIHEVPQEIADFGVLLYSGLSWKKALAFNFLSACTAIAGTIAGLFLGMRSEAFIEMIIPFAAGAFIYIAGSNLLPELFRKKHALRSLLFQTAMFVLGIALMYGVLFLE